MASKSSLESCYPSNTESFEVQRAYLKHSKPFTGGVPLKLTNKTYKIITVHFNEQLLRCLIKEVIGIPRIELKISKLN